MIAADLQELVEVLPVPALLVSRDGSIEAANRKFGALVERKTGEIIQHKLGGFVADAPEKVERCLRQWMRCGQLSPGVLHFRNGGGTLRCRCDGALFRPAADCGQIFVQVLQHDTVQTEFAGLNRKIAALNTEIRRARETEAALRRSNDELQRFAYVASHDMREPLRTICSFAQLLEKRCGPALDFEGHEYIGFLVTAAQRMSCLIDGLLEYSRVMNSPDGALDVIDSAGVLEEVRFRLQAIIKETGARIVWDHLPIVQAHRLGLVQVFQNLVANALKYRSREAPVVQISAREAAHEWIFAVRDNGIGIEPRYHERIFEIFRRLHGHDLPGSGLGLSISRAIVERHGGRIWVESELGAGATFYFMLPKRTTDARALQEAAAR